MSQVRVVHMLLPLLLAPGVPTSSTACTHTLAGQSMQHATSAAAHAQTPCCCRTCRHSESFCVRRLSTVGTATAGFWRSSATTCAGNEQAGGVCMGGCRGYASQRAVLAQQRHHLLLMLLVREDSRQ